MYPMLLLAPLAVQEAAVQREKLRILVNQREPSLSPSLEALAEMPLRIAARVAAQEARLRSNRNSKTSPLILEQQPAAQVGRVAAASSSWGSWLDPLRLYQR